MNLFDWGGSRKDPHFRFPASLFGIIAQPLRDRLTVGHSPLEAGIGVRIPIPQPNMEKNYCIFGDSVTQAPYVKIGWVGLFRQFLEEKNQKDSVNIFNLGVSGNTSEDILKRFDAEASVREPTDIIFAVGINDSGYFRIPSKPVVEESKFVLNLEELIAKARKFSQDITFIGLVLGDDSILKPFPESSTGHSYTRERAKAYDRIIKEMSEKKGCRFVYIMDKLDSADFQDGLHPNEQGHRKMFEVIKKYF